LSEFRRHPIEFVALFIIQAFVSVGIILHQSPCLSIPWWFGKIHELAVSSETRFPGQKIRPRWKMSIGHSLPKRGPNSTTMNEQAAPYPSNTSEKEADRIVYRRVISAGAVALVIVATAVILAVALQPTPAEPEPYRRPVEDLQTMVSTDPVTRLKEIQSVWVLAGNDSSDLDQSVDALEADDTDIPAVRAAQWILGSSHIIPKSHLHRWMALVVIYYTTNGSSWTDATHWLSTTQSYCNWYGIVCAREYLASPAAQQMVAESIFDIQLGFNNLQGPIPMDALRLLKNEVHGLSLSDNAMKGTIPEELGNDMVALQTLYLQHNDLTGTVPGNLDQHILGMYFGLRTKSIRLTRCHTDTIMVQGNDLGGDWPTQYCPSCPTCNDAAFVTFSLDCGGANDGVAKVFCSSACCFRDRCFTPHGNPGTQQAPP